MLNENILNIVFVHITVLEKTFRKPYQKFFDMVNCYKIKNKK